MYKLLLLIALASISSCITGISRWYVLERSTPDRNLSVHCEHFATGEFEPYPPWKERWGAPIMIGSLLADGGILYALAAANGGYAFTYFAVGYAFAGAESFPPQPQAFGSWCGKPEAPLTPPADYFYAISVPDSDSCNPLDVSSTRILLHQALDDVDHTFIPDSKIHRLKGDNEATLSSEYLPGKGVCLQTLHVIGGQEALRDRFSQQNGLNGD